MIYNIKTIHLKLNINEPIGKASSPKEAHYILKEIFATLDADQEHMILLALDNANQIRGYKAISSGGQTSTDPDMKIIFRNALLLGATSIILAHNHPSGTTKPSEKDIVFTEKVKKAGELLSINVLDHIIMGNNGWYAFSER